MATRRQRAMEERAQGVAAEDAPLFGDWRDQLRGAVGPVGPRGRPGSRGASGAGDVGGRIVTLLDRSSSLLFLGDSAAELVAYSFVLPVAQLRFVGGVRLRLQGNFFNDSGSSRTYTLGVVLGSTVMWRETSASVGANANQAGCWLDCNLWEDPGVLVQRLTGLWYQSQTSAANVGVGSMDNLVSAQNRANFCSFYGTALENAAAALTLKVTIQFSAANGSLFLLRTGVTLESLPL